MVFPTSLKGAALNWYTQLPAESIDSFSTLARRFTAQYATSRPHHITSAALAGLKQNDDEPLRAFMEQLSPDLLQQLEAEILQNADFFAWSSADMPGIDADFICHSFLGAYSGYNQIMMYPPDEVYTSFITDHANYCYRVMPFSLKNTGATYQRLMDKVFHHQIGRNMEVYVDDMVVKTTSAVDHAIDLAEVFAQIRKHSMRLNLEKCVFSVQGRKFLGFMIISRGIEANPEKCKAIIQMQSPQTVKEVQRLAGRLTYRADTMILVEVGETSHRRQVFDSKQNAQESAADLDLVDELRYEAQIHEEECKLRASRRYNTRVRPRSFRVGDLVWRLLGEAQKDTSDGKLAPTWGGPFR
uniref:Retrovirus-related Pol polyprotein from transposon 17.6 n=1 Tax=Cajanus cajan TaxID=3821 RepID=A0A151R358_CAJCA|nr:Retrovirus-related Pol polyprotein from transposon 17.6 [Cajanus cajan]